MILAPGCTCNSHVDERGVFVPFSATCKVHARGVPLETRRLARTLQVDTADCHDVLLATVVRLRVPRETPGALP